MSDDDTFGFGASAKPAVSSLSDKLAAVKPAAPPAATAPEDVARIDRVAEKRGFKSREATPTAPSETRRRKGTEGPFVAINTRAPVRVADPFIAWCERERYSYWQGIEELMKRANIS